MSNNPSLLCKLIASLNSEFAMKDLGHLHYFLGIEITPFSGWWDFFYLNPSMLVIYSRKKILHCKTISSPLTQEHDFHIGSALLTDLTKYRSIVGGLQYITFYSTWFILYAINLVCQFMQQPTLKNWQRVKRILWYMKGTINCGLRILSQSSLNLYAFFDTNWVGCPKTRPYTTCYCVFLGSNCIYRIAKRQTTVAQSSAKA